MPSIRPINHRLFEKFLLHIGCYPDRQVGDHKIYKRAGLTRPLVVRIKKDLPIMEIRSNLKTLGISNEEYLAILENL